MPVVTYKCPNCGGPLQFQPDGQDFKCDFCLSRFTEQQVKDYAGLQTPAQPQPAAEPEKEREGEVGGASVYTCSSCGAQVVTDETTAATFCYYCHNPVILSGRLSGEYQPEMVLPFQIDRKGAEERFKNWCRKKPLLSRKFLSASSLEKLTGVYIPFWLFDCDATGRVAGEGRRVRMWTSGKYQYTETKFYHVARSGQAVFAGVPADGAKNMDDHLMEVLEPYDYSRMEPFAMSYLSGYFAQKYDVNKEEVSGSIYSRVEQDMEQLLRGDISGYSSVSVTGQNMAVNPSRVAYVLLPAWLFTYQFKGKNYLFALNGQTGKIAGKLPASLGRGLFWFSLIYFIGLAITLLGGLLLS